jgi:hypothetical protein
MVLIWQQGLAKKDCLKIRQPCKFDYEKIIRPICFISKTLDSFPKTHMP